MLGPCLFLAYINDLPDKLTALASLFADDTSVYKVVANSEQQDQLQQDIQRLSVWEKSWDSRSILQSVCPCQSPGAGAHWTTPYVLHGHCIDTVHTVKYLGVTLHRDVSWDTHINKTVNKANRTLGFLRRNLKISSSSIKEKSYKALVRPLLEYASSVWDLFTQKSIDKLGAVQRRAARFVLNRYHNTSSVSRLIE